MTEERPDESQTPRPRTDRPQESGSGDSGRRDRPMRRNRRRPARSGGWDGDQSQAVNRSRPLYDNPRSGGRPSGGRPTGGRPAGGRPAGGRPYGGRPSNGGGNGGRPANSNGGWASNSQRGDNRGPNRGRDGGRPNRGDRPRGRDSSSRSNYDYRDRGNGAPRGDRAREGRGGRGYGAPRGFTPREERQPSHPNRVETEDRLLLPDNPREAALRILHEVDTRGVFSDRLLDAAHSRSGWDARDQALLHELVKGSLRWRGRIDWVLDPIVHIGIHNVQPWVRNVLRLGAYQLLFLDRVPAHAAVDESVKLANKYGHPGVAGLANSVLRRLADEMNAIQLPTGDDVDSLAAWGSHPRWIVQRWLDRFGPEATRALLEANNRAIPVGLRVNPLKGTREQLIARLAKEEVQASAARLSPDLVWVESHHAPGRLAAFRQGYCTAQDESESLVGRLVAPVAHERLLDLCAAPGGKSTHLAELMEDDGEVWAVERAPERVQSLEQAVARLGVHSIHVVQGDGRTYAFPMPFDRALVDAPCSGLGVLGRRADARWRKTPDILREMPPIQLDLLAAAGRRLRPGGVLVYSVCSFEPEETDHVIQRFLHANPAFVHETAEGVLPDEVVDEHGFMRIFPHVHGCDGAFAARFRKT